jgi:hypothetical protein
MTIERTADKTIFTLRDSGDSSIGIAPAELTLTYDWQIDRSNFDEILDLLHSLNDIGWHGAVTAFVEYETLTITGWEKELKKQVENYKGTSQIQVSIY